MQTGPWSCPKGNNSGWPLLVLFCSNRNGYFSMRPHRLWMKPQSRQCWRSSPSTFLVPPLFVSRIDTLHSIGSSHSCACSRCDCPCQEIDGLEGVVATDARDGTEKRASGDTAARDVGGPNTARGETHLAAARSCGSSLQHQRDHEGRSRLPCFAHAVQRLYPGRSTKARNVDGQRVQTRTLPDFPRGCEHGRIFLQHRSRQSSAPRCWLQSFVGTRAGKTSVCRAPAKFKT